jgi:hypothetical protein
MTLRLPPSGRMEFLCDALGCPATTVVKGTDRVENKLIGWQCVALPEARGQSLNHLCPRHQSDGATNIATVRASLLRRGRDRDER